MPKSRPCTTKSDQGFRNQRLSDIAETQVTLWASQGGFVVNEAQRDRRGWDQYLEFMAPSHSDKMVALPGMPASELSCKIQVKATRGSSLRIPVKLSNWHRFVQEPIPCFFIVLVYHHNEVARVYLVHVWQPLIERTLERIYKLSTDERKALHKKTLNLLPASEDQIIRPWPASLRERIASCAGPDLFLYAQRKAELYETAGYADRALSVRLTFRAPSTEQMYEKCARLGVGLQAVEFKQFEASRTRFGVAYPDWSVSGTKEGSFEILPSDSHQSWMLRVVLPDGSNPIYIPCIVRSSAQVFPSLPENYWLLRVQTTFLDLLVRLGSHQLTFSFNPPENHLPCRLNSLYRTCALLDRLSAATHEQRNLRFQISRQGRHFEFQIVPPSVSLSSDTREFIRLVEACWHIARYFDIDLDVEISARELVSMRPELLFLSFVLNKNTFRVGAVVASTVAPDKTYAIVTSLRLKFAEHTYVVTVAICGSPTVLSSGPENTEFVIEGDDARILKWWVLRDEEAAQFSLETALDSAIPELKTSGIEDVVRIAWADYIGATR